MFFITDRIPLRDVGMTSWFWRGTRMVSFGLENLEQQRPAVVTVTAHRNYASAGQSRVIRQFRGVGKLRQEDRGTSQRRDVTRNVWPHQTAKDTVTAPQSAINARPSGHLRVALRT